MVSGPSGSGKTTLLSRLLGDEKLKRKFAKSISVTTRPKRSGEKNGKDYFFINQADFRRKKAAKKILEWTKYLGYDYATPRDFVDGQLKKGRHIILCLDLKGAKAVRKIYPRNTVTIFVEPPSLEALRQRIEGRCQKTEETEIARRLKLARQELAASCTYDYRLVNKKLAQAVAGLKRIILKKINQSRQGEE